MTYSVWVYQRHCPCYNFHNNYCKQLANNSTSQEVIELSFDLCTHVKVYSNSYVYFTLVNQL